jgi:predicted aldo/keto reductase-like oxidoreductase
MMEELKKLSDLYCTGCNYCMPCPSDINIPEIFEAFTYHNVYGMTDHAKNMWNDELAASILKCTDCGICIEKCPQNINIPVKIKEVSKIMSAL